MPEEKKTNSWMFYFEARQEIMLKLQEKRFDIELCILLKRASTALLLILKEHLCIFDLSSECENKWVSDAFPFW